MQHQQKTAIFLIGMMATGKTTIGRELAARLGWDFFDVDKEIESRCGVPVSQIFETEGEAGFRVRETQMMAELTSRDAVVIAMGGGAPMFEINRKLLSRGTVVQFVAKVSDIIERTRLDRSRPLLQSQDPVARVRQLLLERTPTYDAVSDVSVSTGRRNPADVVETLMSMPEIMSTVQAGNEKRIKQEQPIKESK